MKKIFVFGFLAFLGFAPHVFAQGFTALAPIPSLTDAQTTSVLDGNTLALFFNNLYRYLIGLAATLAVIEIVWAGLDISFFHKDAVSAIVDDKGRIYNAIFGLILVLSPYLVFSIINPSILNLSLNLPPIKLDIPAGGVSSGLPPAPTTGCTTAHSGSYLETAVCASQPDAQSYICKNGLTLQVPVCKVSDAASPGKCLDTSTTVYCAGKNTTLVFYAYTTFKGLKLNLVTTTPVPRDAEASKTFEGGCRNDGGVVTNILTSGAAFAVTGISGLLLTPFYSGCSSDYGVIPVDTNQYSGAQCFSSVLSCNPPK